MSVVLEHPKELTPQIDNKSTYYNKETGETYFKVFLLNNKVNKRKFKLSNLQQMYKDVDGYENLSLTFVKEGLRKGNHPNPKDANIFEANYQNRYTYVNKAIEYYNSFGIAKLVKIFKPDPNLLTASNSEPILNYYALCKTTNPVMLELLASAEKEGKNIYVSPAMFSWDWIKDQQTGVVNVNSFVPTHLAIVDSPAYDPEIAYIKKQTCQKDGMSCYYELFEASEIENLNNDNPQTDNMSTNQFPRTFEEYMKSIWSVDVTDQKSINAEDVVKNKDNYIILDKSKLNNPNQLALNPNYQQQQPAPITNNSPNNVRTEQTTTEEQKEVPKKETPKKETEKTGFTLEDVQKLLAEQENRIMTRIKAEQTKGEREQLLDNYIHNEKVKEAKDKIDQEKLKQTRELYNSLPLDNQQLKTVLDYSIYNPKVANVDVYTSMLPAPTKQETTTETTITEQQKKIEPKGAPKNPVPPAPITGSQTQPITSVPPKPNTNLNMFGTEFKNSADSTNKYNDNYKGKDFNASKSDNEYHPIPTTGEGIPKKFQKYIQ